uniref:DUF5681 domain-containing protein n=1 Tax=Parerythrobacter lutipelagi TaxID=1964208 RepID=UPI0010F76E88|nr:DUF5681 domain-containing protein [Parerythrobacter lutipelagi]
MSDDYEVGYGKPPKSGQWAPGQSGNPAGSSKKAKAKKKLKTLEGYYLESSNELVEVTFGGKKEQMPIGKAIMKSMMYDILKAGPKLKLEFLEKHKKLGLEGLQALLIEEEECPDELPLSPEELLLIEAIKAEMAAEEAMKNQKDDGDGMDCDPEGEAASAEFEVDFEETLTVREC